MENEDVIRRQMEETRSSLSEKVDALEQKIVDTVTETTDAVSETVTTVKETVEESVHNVKDFFDLRGHVEHHPWAMVGGSVAAGFVVGAMLPSRVEPTVAAGMASASATAPTAAPTGRKLHHNGGATATPSRRQQQPAAPTTSWFSQFEPELNRLKTLALGAALGTIREMISNGLPEEMSHQVRTIIDDVTRKVGGEPLPSSDVENLTSMVKGFTQGSHESGDPANMGQPLGETPGQAPGEHTKRFTMQ